MLICPAQLTFLLQTFTSERAQKQWILIEKEINNIRFANIILTNNKIYLFLKGPT